MASKEIEVLDPAATVEKLKNLASRRAMNRPMNRRNFVTALGVTGAAAGAALVSSRTPARPSTVSALGPAQADYLNFLLNIKYLEATYYSYITQGADLPASLTVASGTMYQPPAKVTFPTQQITDLVNEIYYDELSHVIGLRNILGAAAVTRPAMNLQGLNTTASTTAVTVTPAAALGTIRLFEDVGVTAINYLAQYLTSNYLTSAAQVLATEAFHAGALRLIVIQQADALVPPAYLTFTGIITSGSAVITNVSNTAGLIVGATIIGTGIASGAKISAITVASQTFGTGTITMSANATASTAANVTTFIATNTPSDGLDVEPVDPGAAQVSALATTGPLLVAGTSNPPIYEGFFNTASIANGTEATPAGFSFARTTGQVLTILYSTYTATSFSVAIAGTGKGGYFPLGMTGVINSIPTQG